MPDLNEQMRAIGVSRDAESPGGKGVLVSFNRAPTDDELRALHDQLRQHGSAAQAVSCAVRICPERDIECGERERSWCATCPKRKAAPPVADAEGVTSVHDDNAFQILLDNYVNAATEHRNETGTYEDAHTAYKTLIAYIDTLTVAGSQGGKAALSRHPAAAPEVAAEQPAVDSPVLAWLYRAADSGLANIAGPARAMLDYYQGAEPAAEPELLPLLQRVQGGDRYHEIARRVKAAAENKWNDVFQIEMAELIAYVGHIARAHLRAAGQGKDSEGLTEIALRSGGGILRKGALYKESAPVWALYSIGGEFIRALDIHDQMLVESALAANSRAEAAAGAVPEGFALVPVEPPLMMAKAFRDADTNGDRFLDGYAAMIAAAPPAQGLSSAPTPWLETDEGKAAIAAAEAEAEAYANLPRPSHETIVTEGDTLVCTACGTTAPAAAPSEPVANIVALAANSILHSHKVSHLQDEDGEAYSLVDLLSAPDTIATGNREIELIVDAICSEFEAITPSFATPPAQDAGTGAPRKKAPDDMTCLKCPRDPNKTCKYCGIRAIANSGRTE